MRANSTIVLLDVETLQDDNTGERSTAIINYRKINGERTNVGMSTFWSAAAANVQLDYSINIRARMYAGQKYAVVESEVFDIYNAGKADNQVNTRLNVRRIEDQKLKGEILDALELIQTP